MAATVRAPGQHSPVLQRKAYSELVGRPGSGSLGRVSGAICGAARPASPLSPVPSLKLQLLVAASLNPTEPLGWRLFAAPFASEGLKANAANSPLAGEGPSLPPAFLAAAAGASSGGAVAILPLLPVTAACAGTAAAAADANRPPSTVAASGMYGKGAAATATAWLPPAGLPAAAPSPAARRQLWSAPRPSSASRAGAGC